MGNSVTSSSSSDAAEEGRRIAQKDTTATTRHRSRLTLVNTPTDVAEPMKSCQTVRYRRPTAGRGLRVDNYDAKDGKSATSDLSDTANAIEKRQVGSTASRSARAHQPTVRSTAPLRRPQYGVDIGGLVADDGTIPVHTVDPRTSSSIEKDAVPTTALMEAPVFKYHTITAKAKVDAAPRCTSASPPPPLIEGTFTDEDTGFGFSYDDSALNIVAPAAESTEAAKDSSLSAQSSRTPVTRAQGGTVTPWKPGMLDFAFPSEPRPAETEDAVVDSARRPRLLMSTTPRPFSPKRSNGSRSAAPVESRADLCSKDGEQGLPASETTSETSSPTRRDNDGGSSSSYPSDSRLSCSVDFFDLYFHGATVSPSTAQRDEARQPVPVQSQATEPNTSSSSSSSNSSGYRYESGTSRTAQHQEELLQLTPTASTIPRSSNRIEGRERSPTPAMSPAMVLNVVAVSASTKPMPTAKRVPGLNRLKATPLSIQSSYGVNNNSSGNQPTSESVLTPSIPGSGATANTWSNEQNRMWFALPRQTVLAPLHNGHFTEAPLNHSAPYLRPSQRQQQMQAETAVYSARRRPPFSQSQQRLDPDGSSASLLSSSTMSVSFVLEDDQACLAMLSSQRMNLAQPRAE
jgi:hypothetical protein